MITRRGVALACLVLLGACDGSADIDAGVDAGVRPIEVTVSSSSVVETVPARAGGSIAPRAGFAFYWMSVTIAANEGEPVPVAPIAFTLTLDDDTNVTANAQATNNAMDGCDSREVAIGASTTCNVAFEVAVDPPAARSLTWSDGIRSVTVRVPAS